MNVNRRPSTVERAYQLARSGECLGLKDVHLRLSSEGHLDIRAHLYGRSIIADLGRLMQAAQKAKLIPAAV
jgi:hypothetical protein